MKISFNSLAYNSIVSRWVLGQRCFSLMTVKSIRSLTFVPIVVKSNCFAVILLFAAMNFLNAFLMSCNGELNLQDQFFKMKDKIIVFILV